MIFLDIKNDRLMLLKKVKKQEEISPSDLYNNDETVEETFGSKRTVQRALKELCNSDEDKAALLSREKSGKKWMYSLSDRGQSYLRKVKKRERQKKDEEDIFDYDTGYEEFLEYWEKEKYGFQEVQKASIGRNFVYLDYEDLERFNYELADDLVADPDRVLDAAEEAVRSMPEADNDVEVRIKNVSEIETQSINDLSARDRNKLVTVEGVIQSVSRPGSKIVSAEFECENCGMRYTKEQDSQNLKSPYKCNDCGSRKFDPVQENHKTVRYVSVKEKPDERNREKIIAVVEGDLAEDESKNLKAMGSGVKIVGYLDTYLKNKNDEFQSFRLIANNIEIEDSKWQVDELSREEVDRIHELSDRDDIEEYLPESLAYSEIKNNHLLKKAFTVWRLGKNSNYGNLHVLCVGDPGTGKSGLGNYMAENDNKVLKSVATGASEVGLTAAVVKDEMTGEWTAEAGSLAMADGGFHITDEVDELDDDHYSAYNEALSDESISLAKAGIQAELSADVSEFALGNPSPYYSFDEHTPKIEQVPIDKDDLISRFGVMLAVENDKDTEKQMEKVEHILQRGEDQSFEGEDHISEDTWFNYVHYASRISPYLTDDAHEKILSACRSLFEQGDDDRLKLRHAEALASISCAFAKMNLSEEVQPRHVDSAFDFFTECYKSIGFDLGSDDFTSVDSQNNRKRRLVQETYEQLSGPDDRKVPVDDLVDEVDLSEKLVVDALESLKSKGEMYEPEQGKVAEI